jgi:hypothetical protein
MKLSKLSIPVATIGVINGIIFGVILEVFLRLAFIFETYAREPLSAGINISYLPYPFSWWFLPLLSLATVSVSTAAVYTFLDKGIKSVVWFWQTVGIATVIFNVAFSIIFIFSHWWFESRFDGATIETTIRAVKEDLSILILAFPLLQSYNLIFALVLKHFKLYLP